MLLLFFFFSAYSNCFFLFLWNKDSLKQQILFFILTLFKIIFYFFPFSIRFIPLPFHTHSLSQKQDYQTLIVHSSPIFLLLLFLCCFTIAYSIHRPSHRSSKPSSVHPSSILLTHLRSLAPFIRHPHRSSLRSSVSHRQPTQATPHRRAVTDPSPSAYLSPLYRYFLSAFPFFSICIWVFVYVVVVDFKALFQGLHSYCPS